MSQVKADLAKTRFRGAAQKKRRWGKHHAKYEEVETEIKAQAHGNKSKGTRKRGRGIAKEEIQAPSLLNSTKEGKPNNHRTSFSEGQDANSVKTARKIKNLPRNRNDRGKRKIDHDLNSRQSKKSRGCFLLFDFFVFSCSCYCETVLCGETLQVMLKVGKSIEIHRENLTARRGAAQFLDPRGTDRIW